MNIQENQKVSFGEFSALDAAAKNSNYSKRVVYGLMKIITNIHENNFLVTSFFSPSRVIKLLFRIFFKQSEAIFREIYVNLKKRKGLRNQFLLINQIYQ